MIPTANDAGLLFTPENLSHWLGRTVVETKGLIVEQVVWGWLKPVLGAEARPAPVPDEVFSWAVELGAIAHENPAGLSSKQLGPAQQGFSLERRNEILRAAGQSSAGTATDGPQGCFPPAPTYPDPARW